MPGKHLINIRLAFFFPWFFLIPAFIGLLISGGFLMENIYGGLVGIIFCLFVLTTHYRFEIDPNGKFFQEYLWLFGFRKGKKVKFDSIDHIGLIKKKIRRTYNSRGSSTTIVHNEYEGYILFTENEKINLHNSEKKARVEKKITELANNLEVPFKDLTD